jgi:uncharacterized membrane protein
MIIQNEEGRMTNGKRLALIGALLMGLLTGWLDFHATEVQGTVLMILVFSFAFSAINPRWAWLIALFMGGGIPLVAYVARGAALQPVDSIPSNPWYAGIVLPLVFSFVAAYAGVFIHWLVGYTKTTASD